MISGKVGVPIFWNSFARNKEVFSQNFLQKSRKVIFFHLENFFKDTLYFGINVPILVVDKRKRISNESITLWKYSDVEAMKRTMRIV